MGETKLAMVADYGKVIYMGKRFAPQPWKDPESQWFIQEKVDGSQFRVFFGPNGVEYWTRKRRIDPGNPGKLFAPTVAHFEAEIAADPEHLEHFAGFTLVGEAIAKPCHNALTYESTPRGHFVLFDVVTRDGNFAARTFTGVTSDVLGIQLVDAVGPLSFSSEDKLIEAIEAEIAKPSALGGAREGVVVKAATSKLGDPRLFKVVTEAFKETHASKGKSGVVKRGADHAGALAEMLATPARFRKAVQFLEESGELTGQMRDIPKLIARVAEDIDAEDADMAKDVLWEAFRGATLGRVNRDLAVWYKEQIGG